MAVGLGANVWGAQTNITLIRLDIPVYHSVFMFDITIVSFVYISDGACLQSDDPDGTVVSNTVQQSVLNFLPGQIFSADDQCYLDGQTAACGDVSLYVIVLG